LALATQLWSSSLFAHCEPAEGHFDCAPPTLPTPSDPVPGPSDKLTGNQLSRQSATGTDGIKIKAEVANQIYSNNARQQYLLIDAAVKLPAPALGIASKQEAQDARLVLSFFHEGQATAYAECELAPRLVKRRKAAYSLGIKNNAAHVLLRWGHCDDPRSPGFDSVFPVAVGSDKASLALPDGTVVAEFAPPIVVDAQESDRPRKLRQPATARRLEGNAYKIKQQRR
jgi:hypothetical protein